MEVQPLEDEETRRRAVDFDCQIIDGIVKIDEEHPFLSQEEIKASSVVCLLYLTITNSYPWLNLDHDDVNDHQYETVSTQLGVIAWADYDESARLELTEQLSSLGIHHPFHHQIVFQLLNSHQSQLLNDQDYVKNRQQGKTRKSLKIYANFITNHDQYYFDSYQCRLVPTANSVIDSLEKVEAESLDAVTRRENCTICFDELHSEKLATKLPCNHVFHNGCLVQWLQSSHFCPLCRFEMPVDG